jgi:osmotically-inducible protein OsmY
MLEYGSHPENRLQKGALFLAGCGAGAFVMYLLDPARGARRRSFIRDRIVHAAHIVADIADKRSRDMANRARGVAAETQARLREGAIPDHVLVERVHAHLGHVVSHPNTLDVQVDNGHVVVTGPALHGERRKIEDRLSHMRGVREYEVQVMEYTDRSEIPGLQRESRWERVRKAM